MTTYLIHDADQAVSIGSVVADPLPAGLTAVALDATQAAAAKEGRVSWNPTDGVVVAPPDPSIANSATITSKIQAAIDANVTWLGDHATRQAQIDALIADATTGKSATVSNVAQAQAVSRALADGLLRAARGLDALETLMQSVTKQVTAIERLVVSQLDSTDGT